MKFIIAPDKFKGSLSAFEVCSAITAGIKVVDKNSEVISFPMADGGDGFATIMQYYLHTETIHCAAVDPLHRPIEASYQWNEKTKTAIIEMAVTSGLVLLKEDERNPLLTSTYGTGLLIKDAIEKGAVKIVLGIGGSATNDGGTGILEALDFQLKDSSENLLNANGQNLGAIEKIISPVLPNIKFEIACDVQNVLYGKNGASFIYGPQKGANQQQVKILDEGLHHLADILLRQTGKDVSDIPGTGAAGGIPASLMCFFDTTLKQGIDMIIDASGIYKEMVHADMIITGEGKIDKQSMDGKVIGTIAAIANEKNIPVIAFCGRLDLNKENIKETGLSAAYAIGESLSVEESMRNAEKLLKEKTATIITSLWEERE